MSAGLLEFVGTTQEWRTVNRLDLVEANFGRIQDSGGDPADDPDFSASGEPITFGFFTALSGGIGGGSVSLTQGYDNWSVVVQTVPEPSPVPALSLWSLPLIAALLLVSSFLVLRSRPEN